MKHLPLEITGPATARGGAARLRALVAFCEWAESLPSGDANHQGEAPSSNITQLVPARDVRRREATGPR